MTAYSTGHAMTPFAHTHVQRLITRILLLVFVSGAFLNAIPITHAQDDPPPFDGPELTPPGGFDARDFQDSGPPELSLPADFDARDFQDSGPPELSLPGGFDATAADGDPDTVPHVDDSTVEVGNVQSFIYNAVISMFGVAARAGGYLMDQSVHWFIRNFADLYDSSFGYPVEQVWEAVRDLMNLALIFGLIYIGFRFILDSDDSSAKRNLVMLIIAALLVNFSLFFTKTIVDISHVAANSFENSIQTAGGERASISASFVDALNFSAVLAEPHLEEGTELAVGSVWGLIFMAIVVLLVAGFVFAAIAVLITVRFIVLIFLMIFSPIMVLGMIFPNMQSLSRQWMDTFLKQAFMAPAIFLMLYTSLVIINAMADQVASGGFTAFDQTSSTQLVGAIPFYIMGMGFLIGSLIVAQKMGAYGATATIAVGNRMRKSAQGIAYRNTAGRALHGVASAHDWAAKNDGRDDERRGVRKMARQGLRIGAKLGESYLGTSSALKTAGDYGAGGTGLTAAQEAKKKRDQGLQQRDSEAKLKADLASPDPNIQQAAVAKLNQRQIEEMLTQKERGKYAHLLSEEQWENVLKSDKIGEGDLADMKERRRKHIHDNIHTTIGTTENLVLDELTKLTQSQLETLGAEFIEQYAHLLSDTQIGDLRKSKKLSDAQKQSFLRARNDNLTTQINNTGVGGVTPGVTGSSGVKEVLYANDGSGTWKPRKGAEVAQLPRDVLLNPNTAEHITAAALQNIADKKTLSPADQQALARNIRGTGNADAQAYLRSNHAIRNWG